MHTNRLIDEKSPYLLQHAHNPVDWHPWDEEAFAKARREDKPIFLSVGYSTCHWCHVMAHESFENEEIAAILNRNFVSVKVDREERPDIDNVYMTYVQATTGSGGWPMSVWLTPELKPFFGGTYYPPEERWGQPGFKSILTRIAEAWTRERDRIVSAADEVTQRLRQATSVAPDPAVQLERELIDQTYRQIRASYDPKHGGFGDAPKFPRPSAPDFMLRHHARSGTQDALDMTLHTLQAMAEGGMYDHLGGGFHRYSVDERWQVPHFEKMLYDQAQLVRTYLDAHQITRDPFHARIARETLDYVRRDMTGSEGQFLSAEDADSDIPGRPGEHAEGAFYVWERDEIDAVLEPRAAELFRFHYGVEENGNVRSDPQGEFRRKNILHIAHSLEETAARFDETPEHVVRLLAEARSQLFDKREERPRPHLDDKTITAWNGLMISAFARAHQVLEDRDYLEAARAAANVIRTKLHDEQRGVLLRRYRRGVPGIDGYLDDYAFLIRGLLDLYEASFEVDFLTWAVTLQNQQDKLFRDERAGGYFSTSGHDETVLLRMKHEHDGAEPSANSISALNLLRLGQMTDNRHYRDQADKTMKAFAQQLKRAPHAMPLMVAAFARHIDNSKQIIIAGDPEAEDTKHLLREVHARFIPDKILMLADGGESQKTLARQFPFIESVERIDGKATAYVCENSVCKPPTNDARTLAKLLDGDAGTGRDSHHHF